MLGAKHLRSYQKHLLFAESRFTHGPARLLRYFGQFLCDSVYLIISEILFAIPRNLGDSLQVALTGGACVCAAAAAARPDARHSGESIEPGGAAPRARERGVGAAAGAP